jgi:carbon monoxide dehydrogenase subunit G
MIETQQSVLIDAPIETVWSSVQDISRWASLFPGCKDCTVIDAQDSRWVIKVGAGGLVRTVNVWVHVEQWDAPQCVSFSYKLEGDPVEGAGCYLASARGADSTEVTLSVRVAGTGPMAAFWETVSKPLLPRLAKSFAEKLKAQIEQAAITTSQ